jgi:hypothetical protein
LGHSSSHGSPKTRNWKAVSLGYVHPDIPIKRIVSEIWLAAENQQKPLSSLLKSETIYRCQEAIKKSENMSQAYQNVEKEILSSKQNSIIAEFAKRAIPGAFKTKEQAQEWRSAFFSEVTNYLVSRDISGYVGSKFRNKTIGEVVKFKEEIKKAVYEITKKIKVEPTSSAQWKQYVSNAITEIIKTKP